MVSFSREVNGLCTKSKQQFQKSSLYFPFSIYCPDPLGYKTFMSGSSHRSFYFNPKISKLRNKLGTSICPMDSPMLHEKKIYIVYRVRT